MNIEQTEKADSANAVSTPTGNTQNCSGMMEAERVADTKPRVHTNIITTNNFDAHGNTIRIEIDHGDGHIYIIKNTYAFDNAESKCLGRLSFSTVRSTVPCNAAQDKTTVRKSEFTNDSDGLPLLQTAKPDNALAVTTTDSAHVEAASSRLIHQRTSGKMPLLHFYKPFCSFYYTRDPQGRIVSTQIDPVEGSTLTSETHSVLDSTGRFHTKTMNALSHSKARVHDFTRGWLLSRIGLNHRTTPFYYNALGRGSPDRPDDTRIATEDACDDSRSVTNPRSESSAMSKYRVTTKGSAASPSTIGYDRVGRAICACAVGFGQVRCVADNDYAAISPTPLTKTTFNISGRVDVATSRDDTRAKTIYNGLRTTNKFGATDQTLKRVYDTLSAGGVNLAKVVTCDRPSRSTSASVAGAGTVNISYDNLANITHRTPTSDLGNVGACGYANGATASSMPKAGPLSPRSFVYKYIHTD